VAHGAGETPRVTAQGDSFRVESPIAGVRYALSLLAYDPLHDGAARDPGQLRRSRGLCGFRGSPSKFSLSSPHAANCSPKTAETARPLPGTLLSNKSVF